MNANEESKRRITNLIRRRSLTVAPLSEEALNHVLALRSADTLAQPESEHLEFKASFNKGSLDEYARTVAGFANNSGGYILFGVNNAGKIVGLQGSRFDELDTADVTNYLNHVFQPHVRWDKRVVAVNSMKVGLLYAFKCDRKPVICCTHKGCLKEGSIYFRYMGTTALIRFAELNALLDERDRVVAKIIAGRVEQIARYGPSNIALLELENGQITGAGGNLVLDPELLERVKFIREGQFDDTIGDPTLKVIGNVAPLDSQPLIQHGVATSLSQADMIGAYLRGDTGVEPEHCLRQMCHFWGKWFPLYYFTQELSKEAVLRIWNSEQGAYAKTVKGLTARFEANEKPPATSRSKHGDGASRLIKGEWRVSADNAGTLDLLRSIRCLQPRELDFPYLKSLVLDAMALGIVGPGDPLWAEIKYAAAFLDYYEFCPGKL